MSWDKIAVGTAGLVLGISAVATLAPEDEPLDSAHWQASEPLVLASDPSPRLDLRDSVWSALPPVTASASTDPAGLDRLLLTDVLQDLRPVVALSDTPIGTSLGGFGLHADNQDARGLAFDATTSHLFVLDSGRSSVFEYEHQVDAQAGTDELVFVGELSLPGAADGTPCSDTRGLTLAWEGGQRVLYLLSWREGVFSRLWRWGENDKHAEYADLTADRYELDCKEVLGVTHHDGRLYVSFDPRGYASAKKRVRRGVLRLKVSDAQPHGLSYWSFLQSASILAPVKHMPSAGREDPGVYEGGSLSFGLATVLVDEVPYLYGTISGDSIYAAHLPTGRGLFHFGRPPVRGTHEERRLWGLTFGDEALWVATRVEGIDRVERVNVTTSLNAPSLGARQIRRVTMEITSTPASVTPLVDRGAVKHNYDHPREDLHQGIDASSLVVTNLAGAFHEVLDVSRDPSDDEASREYLTRVKYTNTSGAFYASRWEMTVWGRASRHFIYPHRVSKEKLAGTSYTADDATLYKLSDAALYEAFVERVREHIESEYGEPADMDNPYWAARNVVEYVLETYHYPTAPDFENPYDPAAGHYANNPASLKLALSDGSRDGDEIMSCSPSSVVVSGVMRYLGIPARWIGSAHQTGWASKAEDPYDTNGNGFLDCDEQAWMQNGHRWAEVWMGPNYGWQPFDATPNRPDDEDYSGKPARRSQYEFMGEAGHQIGGNQIVFTVGGGKVGSMFKEYEPALGIGGEQRYNLQGKFQNPELWKGPSHHLHMTNPCQVTATLQGGGLVGSSSYTVDWTLSGPWHLDPDAELDLHLETYDAPGGTLLSSRAVAWGVAADAGSHTFELTADDAGWHQLKVVKAGDYAVGTRTTDFRHVVWKATLSSTAPSRAVSVR